MVLSKQSEKVPTNVGTSLNHKLIHRLSVTIIYCKESWRIFPEDRRFYPAEPWN